MSLGLCCVASDAHPAVDAGFDFVELPATQLLEANLHDVSGLPVHSTNLFFPPHVRLFGPDAFDWRDYSSRVLPLAGEAGTKVMVIGGGGQRRSEPPQGPREAEAAFVDIVAVIQEMASPFGITIAPEALNAQETNVFTKANELAEAMSRRGLAYTFDLFHATVEGETSFVRLPAHVHLAGRNRRVPTPDDPVWDAYVRPLIAAGFTGGISLECLEVHYSNLAEIQQAVRHALLDCH